VTYIKVVSIRGLRSDDRCYRTDDERGERHSKQHPHNREDVLRDRGTSEVTIADCSQSLKRPVKTPDILVDCRELSDACSSYPRVLIEVSELGREEPEACEEMDEEHTDE